MPGTIGLMFVLIVLFRQLIPRLVAARNPEMVLHLHVSGSSGSASIVDAAVCATDDCGVELLPQLGGRDGSGQGRGSQHEEEIQAFIDAGQEEGILEDSEGEMIQSIVHFGEKTVREIMTPRTQIVAIEINSSDRKAPPADHDQKSFADSGFPRRSRQYRGIHPRA